MSKEKISQLHSLSEGQRVHYLSNLGGLVVIAGLESIEPNLLLGALCEMSRRLAQVPAERVAELKKIGDTKLAARNAQKRSFKSWQRAEQTERFDFTRDQMKKLILRLEGKMPALDKDISSELLRLLHGVFSGT